ncbi:GHMP family kinase ATP-binding protein [Phytohabitans sp. LJ34]|uniref:GHMP family kinase ATP-binding protein n=1 Tax=Phytohabitans sp. LJ34 TaxID=3452217 RepID=UPI003F888E49
MTETMFHRAELGEAYGSAAAFGTFGELLQGALPDGDDFLVTMPIARWSRARLLFDPRAHAVHVRPAHKSKARWLVEAMLRHHGARGGGVLLLDSDLPEGKGLASSSADLVATARAVGQAIGAAPAPAEIEALLRLIEPTDGVMYHGVVAFHHRQVRLRAELGHLPPMTVVGVDEGGEIDTLSFNKVPKVFSTQHRRTYQRLLAALTAAIRAEDVAAIGEVATRSAVMNQRLCPKRTLDRMLDICRQVGGLGVVAAHSGTALGILLADRQPGHDERLRRTRRMCAALTGTVWVDHSLPGPDGTGYLSRDSAAIGR